MKEKKYWADAELSALLEELGCESFLGNMGSWAISEIDFTPTQKLFHFSDILFPQNAKKIWGDKPCFGGYNMLIVRFIFQQIAVAVMDKLYAVPPDHRRFKLMKAPELKIGEEYEVILPSEEPKIVREIQNIYREIPFKTHRLSGIEYNDEPEWKYRIKELVDKIADDDWQDWQDWLKKECRKSLKK